MATLTPTQNSSETEDSGVVSPNQASGSSGGKESGLWPIPGSLGNGLPSITKIIVGEKQLHPTQSGGIKLNSGAKVVFYGTGLQVYHHAEFIAEGSGGSLEKVIANHDDSGTFLSFTVPNFDKSIKDGGFFWLKLLSKNPQAQKVISPYLVYSVKEEKEDKDEKSKSGQGGGGAGSAEGQQTPKGPGPTAMIVDAAGATMGGIASALVGQSKPKTPQIPTSGQSLAASSAKAQTAGGGGGDSDADIYSAQEPEVGAQQTITSTGQVSTGGQTISQGGTVTAQTSREVSSSGTVTARTGAEISSSGTVKTSGTVSGGTTAQSAATISSSGTVSQNVNVESPSGTPQQSSASSVVSGTVGAEAETVSQGSAAISAEKNQKATVTSASQPKSVDEKTEEKAEASATQSQETKSQVDVSDETQTTISGNKMGGATPIAQPLSSQPISTPTGTTFGGSTATLGLGFKPPASLGTMKKLEVDLTSKFGGQNIAGNLPTVGSGVQPPKPLEAQQDSEKNEPQDENSQPTSAESTTNPEPKQEAPSQGIKPEAPVKPRQTPDQRPEKGPVLGGPEQFPKARRPGERGLPAGGGESPQAARPVDAAGPSEPPSSSPDNENLNPPVGEPKDAQIGQPLQMGDKDENPDQNNNKPKAVDEDKEKDEETEAKEQDEEAAAAKQPIQPQPAQGAKSTGVKSLSKTEIEVELNMIVNDFLDGVALATWASIIGIPLGAIVGDLLWLFKDKIVDMVKNKSLMKVLLSNAEKLGINIKDIKIKFSLQVKLHIIGMNLVVVAALGVILFTIVTLLWGLCNSTLLYPVRAMMGINSVCEAISSSSIGAALNSVAPSGTFQASNNPGTLTGTAQWTSAINTSSQKYNIDACILRVVVQKESGGDPNAIGCDCAANGNPALCLDKSRDYSPSYQFNWAKCSYGIGLTQWTIFPQGSKGFAAWQSEFLPTRNVANNWYGVTDFLNPNTSLDLTAQVFSANLAKANGDVATAFGNYVGVSSVQTQLVNDRMALYNLCKSSQ